MFVNYKIREDYRKETSFVNMKVNKTICRNYTHTDDIIKSIFSSENRKRLIEVFFPSIEEERTVTCAIVS
jgi:hypothetical protein